jgi:hypothetical protein
MRCRVVYIAFFFSGHIDVTNSMWPPESAVRGRDESAPAQRGAPSSGRIEQILGGL